MDQNKIIKVAAVAAVGLLAFNFLGKGAEEETIGGSGSFGGFGGGGVEETLAGNGGESPAPSFNITFPEVPAFNPPSGGDSFFIAPDSSNSNSSTGGTPEATDDRLVSTVENTPKKVSGGGGGGGAVQGDSLGSTLIKLITAPSAPSYPHSGTDSNSKYDLTGVDVKSVLEANTKKEAAMAATVPSYLTQASVDYNKNTGFNQKLADSGLLKSSDSKTTTKKATTTTKKKSYSLADVKAGKNR